MTSVTIAPDHQLKTAKPPHLAHDTNKTEHNLKTGLTKTDK